MAMTRANRARRRAIGGAGMAAAVVAAGAAAAAILVTPGVPAADAAPDPCAASEIAKTVGNVAINAGMYLDSHPQTNQVLTAVAGQPAGPQSLATLKTYFDANPQAATDLQVIQRPLSSLTTKCKLPISLPQVLGMMQNLPQQAPAAAAPVASAAQAMAGAGAAAPAPTAPGQSATPGR